MSKTQSLGPAPCIGKVVGGACPPARPRSLRLRAASAKPDDRLACRASSLERSLALDPAKGPDRSPPSASFSWAKQWYPLEFSTYLDGTRPLAAQLLGQRLVLWRDGEGRARALLDSCPHRQVPLSEGRIEKDGTLQCSYHGWRFDGEGRCVEVPQCSDAAAARTACASQRSQVTRFPCKELQGKVWVFGVGGPTGFLESELVEPALIPELEADDLNTFRDGGGKALFVQKQFKRFTPYDYSILLQNVLDPSHIQFSHHNMIGDRDHEHAGTLVTGLGPPPEGAPNPAASFTGPVRSYDVQVKSLHDWTMQFSAPVLVRWGMPFPWAKTKAKNTLNLHLTPVAPGVSQIMVEVMTPAAEVPWYLRPILQYASPLWLAHMDGHKILDSDGVFLAGQGRYQAKHLAQGTWGSWRRQYYMPAAADRFVSRMLAWLEDQAGGGPTPWREGDPAPGPPPSKEVMLDRYNSHTKHCKCCSGALKGFERLQLAAVTAAAASFLGLAAALGRALPLASVPVLGCVAGLIACLAVWAKARAFAKLFYFWDYEHATNNGPAKL